MELTGYLDFWFRDLPIVERIQHFERLGIRRLDVWLWRERPMAEIYAECQQRGMIINSTFDGDCGNLVDATDHDRVLRCLERVAGGGNEVGDPASVHLQQPDRCRAEG